MGFVVCKCGERISDTMQPNENEGYYVSSFELDEAKYADDVPFQPMVECPKCGSLILYLANGKVRHYRTDDGPCRLFAHPEKH